MKTLPKSIKDRRDEIVNEFSGAASDLESAIERFNATVAQAFEEVTAAVTAYNESVQAADELRGEAQAAVQEYYDARSEKWQQGEAGERYQTWIDDFDSLSLEEIAIEEPTPIEVPEFDAKAAIEDEFPTDLS